MDPARIKIKTLKELSDLYGVDRATMRRYLIRAKNTAIYPPAMGRYYSPRQVEAIFLHLGAP